MNSLIFNLATLFSSFRRQSADDVNWVVDGIQVEDKSAKARKNKLKKKSQS